MTPEKIRALAETSLDQDKAEDIVSIDLSNKTALADYMLICSGTSSRAVAALAEKLSQTLGEAGVQNIRMEGLPNADWVIVDAGDVIVHIFRPEVRAFYKLEDLWGIENTLLDSAIHIPA